MFIFLIFSSFTIFFFLSDKILFTVISSNCFVSSLIVILRSSDFDKEIECRCIVLCSEGKHFCAGANFDQDRDMKDKIIVEERMKQFERDVLHWINYDYVVINENLEKCYSKIYNLILAEINNGSKDYDSDYIRSHIDKLTS